MAVEDLKAALAHGDSVPVIAMYLQRTEMDLRDKMRGLGLSENGR